MLCKERAREWVHVFAAGGGAFSAIPIPMSTTAGLVAVETQMIFWIGRIYGEKLDTTEMAVVAGGLGIGGLVLKSLAAEACTFIPVAGWIVKSAIAVGTIEAIGAAIIRHYEQKYPNKVFSEFTGATPKSHVWNWRPWNKNT